VLISWTGNVFLVFVLLAFPEISQLNTSGGSLKKFQMKAKLAIGV
jgi:hypothetical protein